MAELHKSWWYSIPASHGNLDETRSEYRLFFSNYEHLFSRHYYPAPYVMYNGPIERVRSGRREGKSIYVVGNSTVFGSDLCKLIEESLRFNKHDVEVVNFGTIAANITTMLHIIMNQIFDKNPDVIVLLSGGIDVLTPMVFDPRPEYPHIQFLSEVMFEYFADRSNSDGWLEKAGLSGEDLYNRIIDRLHELRVKFGYLSDAWNQAIIFSYKASLIKILEICESHSIKLVYALEPLLTFKAFMTELEISTLPTDNSMDYIRRQYGALSEIGTHLRASSQNSNSTAILDFHDLFVDDRREIFSDIIHYNQDGAKALSQRISVAVERLIREASHD